MDSIIADFYGGILKAHTEATGVVPPRHCLSSWDATLPDGTPTSAYFKKPGFFRSLEPIYAGLNFMKKARNLGHDVVIVSSAPDAHAPGEKRQWIEEHLPWLPKHDVIFASRKELVQGDVLIDDYPRNAKNFKAEQPESKTVGIAYPYNCISGMEHFDFLALGYNDFDAAWRSIDKYILG